MDRKEASSSEKMIPGERFPSFGFDVEEGKFYKKQVFTYHIPFSGNADLFRCRPSNRILWTTNIDIAGDSISFDIISWSNRPEEIKREVEEKISSILRQALNVDNEVKQFTKKLERIARETVTARKAEHLRQSNLAILPNASKGYIPR